MLLSRFRLQSTAILGPVSFQTQEKVKLLKPILKKHFQHILSQVSLRNAENDHLETTQSNLHQNPYDELLVNKTSINQNQKEVKSFYASHIQQRAKINWIEYDEDNTKLYHNSIKEKRIHNRINLLSQNGKTLSELHNIHNAFISFYYHLMCCKLENKCRIKISF